MKIRMLKDFGGRETGNRRLAPGMVLDLDDELATRLVRNGQAELILDPVGLIENEIEEAAEPVAVELPVDPIDLALHQVEKPKGKKRGGK